MVLNDGHNDGRPVCLLHREIRVWFPPLRVLLLHETGAEETALRMSKNALVRSVTTRGDVLIVTYAGLRCVLCGAWRVKGRVAVRPVDSSGMG